MKQKLMDFLASRIQHYNHNSYWNMRNCMQENKCNKLTRFVYLFRIKRMDAYNNASFGTLYDNMAIFGSTPQLPHGLRGIFISHNAQIGKNARIYHHVTIGEGTGGAPVIGDNVLIGAGAKIIGNIVIGNNVRIGAGCVVTCDVPDNCTVVMNKPRIIKREHAV